MTLPQPCRLHVDLPLVQFRIAGAIADMDAQRAAFASEGFAGWKPCLFCSNICKDLERLDASRSIRLLVARQTNAEQKRLGASLQF